MLDWIEQLPLAVSDNLKLILKFKNKYLALQNQTSSFATVECVLMHHDAIDIEMYSNADSKQHIPCLVLPSKICNWIFTNGPHL